MFKSDAEQGRGVISHAASNATEWTAVVCQQNVCSAFAPDSQSTAQMMNH
jgi:hypothetical protein